MVSHTLNHWLLVDEVAHESDGPDGRILLDIVGVGVGMGVELPSSLGIAGEQLALIMGKRWWQDKPGLAATALKKRKATADSILKRT